MACSHKHDVGDIPAPAPATPRGGPSNESLEPCLFLPAGAEELLSSEARWKQTRNVSARPDLDPIQLVHAMSFASHLRSPSTSQRRLTRQSFIWGGMMPTARFAIAQRIPERPALTLLWQRQTLPVLDKIVARRSLIGIIKGPFLHRHCWNSHCLYPVSTTPKPRAENRLLL